jgi:hypothetical protein
MTETQRDDTMMRLVSLTLPRPPFSGSGSIAADTARLNDRIVAMQDRVRGGASHATIEKT